MDNVNQPLDSDVSQTGNGDNSLRITDTLRRYWHSTSRWALFFAVIGFLYLGMILLSMFGISSFGGEAGYAAVLLLIVGAFVFFPTWFLFQFSQNMQKGNANRDLHATEKGFSFLRRFYQFVGIATIVLIAFYVLMFIFVIGAMVVTMGR
ncbi:MAG: hypothetical protein ABMA02_09750 [Saprospiraceae bacterium]